MQSRTARVSYFRGRGLGEMVRLMCVACGYDLENVYVESKAQLAALRSSGVLVANQLPLLELSDAPIQGVQTMACVRFLARKHGLYSRTAEDDFLCDVFADCVRDFLGHFTRLPFAPDRAAEVEMIRTTWLPKYGAIFERALRANPANATLVAAALPASADVMDAVITTHPHVLAMRPSDDGAQAEQPALVGSSMTYPDVTLTEALLYAREVLGDGAGTSDPLAPFPMLMQHVSAMTAWEPIKRYLASAQRMPLGDSVYRDAVRAVLD
jgi:hypothetical protein